MAGELCVRCSILAAFLGIVVPTVHAQVLGVQDFRLSAPQARVGWVKRPFRGQFAFAVTPGGDVLSFLVQESGEWQLYRVRHWQRESPLEDKLSLKGFISKDEQPDLESVDPRVLVTQDGHYAVCLGDAMWLKRVGGRSAGDARADQAVSVVDLQTFTVVSTTRTRELGLGVFRNVSLDRQGLVRVESTAADRKRHEFIRLSVPALAVGPKCSYEWIGDPFRGHSDTSTQSGCRDALGSIPLDEYLHVDEPPSTNSMVCENTPVESCLTPEVITPDGRFGVAVRRDDHDHFFGGNYPDHLSFVVLSMTKRAAIGEIKQPTTQAVSRALTFVAGRNYLLVLQGGTHLFAYELRD